MPATHPADTITATCLMCAPEKEQTAQEWSQMLWTLAFLDTPKEN